MQCCCLVTLNRPICRLCHKAMEMDSLPSRVPFPGLPRGPMGSERWASSSFPADFNLVAEQGLKYRLVNFGYVLTEIKFNETS